MFVASGVVNIVVVFLTMLFIVVGVDFVLAIDLTLKTVSRSSVICFYACFVVVTVVGAVGVVGAFHTNLFLLMVVRLLLVLLFFCRCCFCFWWCL